ncbi:division plane positioning ATPase MipZ [Kiloniella sp. b19]|uniref:division plane positioning ATPase MipZ n=1 Tax=Kiloniella sp. GXU_MW_B19 TaxID=3141326 RepID=UPI0031CE70C1
MGETGKGTAAQDRDSLSPSMLLPTEHRPRIIVIGNEKGGSGKSTTSMHIIAALLNQGYAVGSIDLDARQGTLSRYIENREASNLNHDMGLLMPQHRRVYISEKATDQERKAEDEANLEEAAMSLWANDYLIVDTPGSDSYLSRLGHSLAEVLITPMNDSFLDMDMLARVAIEQEELKLTPSTYSQMVWEQRQKRAVDRQPPIDWIVMRNRLSHIDAKNKRDMEVLLGHLARRLQFRLAPGFGERVIFRELFPKGLTLLDLENQRTGVQMSMSHVAARQEVRSLLKAAGLTEERA